MDIEDKSNQIIAFEIEMRTATINKLLAVEYKVRIALNEAIARRKHEARMIGLLSAELKRRKDKTKTTRPL